MRTENSSTKIQTMKRLSISGLILNLLNEKKNNAQWIVFDFKPVLKYRELGFWIFICIYAAYTWILANESLELFALHGFALKCYNFFTETWFFSLFIAA